MSHCRQTTADQCNHCRPDCGCAVTGPCRQSCGPSFKTGQELEIHACLDGDDNNHYLRPTSRKHQRRARQLSSVAFWNSLRASTCLYRRHGLRKTASPLRNRPGGALTDACALQWSRLIANTPLAENSRREAARDPVRRLRRFEKEYGHLLVCPVEKGVQRTG